MPKEKIIIEAKEDQERFKKWIGLDKINGRTVGEIYWDKFSNFKQRIKSPYSDLYWWMKNSTPDKFKEYIDDLEIEVSNKQNLKQKEKDGAQLIYSDDTWKVYHIINYEASAKYGKGTKWCITGTERWNDGNSGEKTFLDYHEKNHVEFYFFIKNGTEKYALALYPDGKTYEIFNAEDISISYIPDAPLVNGLPDVSIKDDKKMLINAIASDKISDEIVFNAIEELATGGDFEDPGDYDIIFALSPEAVASTMEGFIPDAYLEFNAVATGRMTPEEYNDITGDTISEFDISNGYSWGGDLPEVVIDEDKFTTKAEACDPKNYQGHKYWYFFEDRTSWNPYDLYWADDKVGLYNSISQLLDFDDMISFLEAVADYILIDVKEGRVSKDVITSVGVSDEYIDNFNISESLKESKEVFFKNSVVRDASGNLLPVYHCSFSEFDTFSIDDEDGSLDAGDWSGEFGFAWFAEDESYAQNYGDGEEYECYLNITKPLDIGEINLDVEVDDGVKIKDDFYDSGSTTVSHEFIRLCKLVKVEPEDMIKWYHKWWETGCIYDITRRAFFKNIIVKLGYDGVIATEGGNKTWGCVRANQVKLISNENPTEKDSMKEDLSKEQEEFFKDSVIRNSNGDLIPMWHGTNVKFEEFDRPINWFSTSKEYAKQYAEWLGGTPTYYEAYLNCKNPFNCGNTSARVFDLIPNKLSRDSIYICRKLDIDEDDFRRLIKQTSATNDKEEYKLKLHTITRLSDFAQLVKSKGYDSIITKEDGYTCVGVFNPEDIKRVNNLKPTSSKNMNSSLQEKKAITWGDLDYGKKTDTRRMMGGRGTGHFGTGFYFVGAEGPYGLDKDGNIKKYDYEPSRPIYKIELDAYNLYKPTDNDSAYRFHDAMKNINDAYFPGVEKWLDKDTTTEEEKLKDAWYNATWKLQDLLESVDDDLDLDLDDFSSIWDELGDDLMIDNLSDEEKDKLYDEEFRELAKKFIKENNLQDFVWQNLDNEKPGRIENYIEQGIESMFRCVDYVKWALKVLTKALKVDQDKLLGIIKKAYEATDNEDSMSTMIMKALGYEGVDVTHLNHDAQGLSGLDNFGYGTVIYDLKPNTFKRIKEPRKQSSGNYKGGDPKEEELDEFLDKVDYNDTGDKPVYATDNAYQLKNLLERGDKAYRIYNDDGTYYFQDASGDKTHYDMLHVALKNGWLGRSKLRDGDEDKPTSGYLNPEDYNEGYMVFIPFNYNTQLRYHTKLGEDSYFNCRVYPFGVVFVRDTEAYNNGLFRALGQPIKEIYYDAYNTVTVEDGNRTRDFDVDMDFDGDPNVAITDDVMNRKEKSEDTLKAEKEQSIELMKRFNIPEKYYEYSLDDLGFAVRVAEDRNSDLVISILKYLTMVGYKGLSKLLKIEGIKQENIPVKISEKAIYTLNEIKSKYKDADETGKEVWIGIVSKFWNVSESEAENYLNKSLEEKIVKKGSKWQVQSEKGKNLGTYSTKRDAEKRLKQVHYFKYVNETLKPVDLEDESLSDADLIICDSPYQVNDFLNNEDFFKINYYPNKKFYVLIDPWNATHFDVNEALKDNGWIDSIDEDFERMAYAQFSGDIFDDLSEYSSEDFNKMSYVESDDGSILVCLDSPTLSDNELVKIFKRVSSRKGVLGDMLKESLNESKQDIEKFKQWAGEDLANRFFKLKDRLKGQERDIYYWMSTQVKEYGEHGAKQNLSMTLRELERTPTRREVDKAGKEDTIKIYEDSRWLVLKILSYEAAVKYGKGTQWCITGNNTYDGRWDFDDHTGGGYEFYFYLTKKGQDRRGSNKEKYCLQFKDMNDWKLWDEEDFIEVQSNSDFPEDEWNPFDTHGKHIEFPNIQGLPDLNKAYEDQARKLGWDKKVIAEELRDNVLDALDKEFGQEEVYMWSTYILPNGHFLNPDNAQDYWNEIEEDPIYEHCDFEDWAYQKGYNLSDIYNNCIKMNVTYPYLSMPDKARPTPEQLNAIRKILDRKDLFEPEGKFYWYDIFPEEKVDSKGENLLAVYSPVGDELFDLDVSDANDIIRAINQAYIRGGFFSESLKEEVEDGDIYYRGYDSRYGVFDSNTSTLYTWVTDEPEYALEYAENNKYGKVAKVRVTCSDDEIGGVFDLPEDVDYYEPGDEEFKEYILDQGLKGYGFEAGDYDDYCICISKDCVEVIDPDVKVDEIDEALCTSKPEHLFKRMSDPLYHWTLKSNLDNIKKKGLKNFWFADASTDLHDLKDMVMSNNDYKYENNDYILLKFHKKDLDISKLDFTDCNNGENEEWNGFGYYNGTLPFENIEVEDKSSKESLNEELDEFDSIVKTELDTLNKWLDEYGFEVELIMDKEILDDIDWSSQYGSDAVGMFLADIQDNASVFPIALNKEVICKICKEENLDLREGIEGTLWHEVGHGIYRFLEDFYEMPEDEEDCVEEFARYKEYSELFDILQDYMKQDESLNESKQDFEKFKAWCNNDDLYRRFIQLRPRLANTKFTDGTKGDDIYMWMKGTPKDLEDTINDIEATPTKKEKEKKAKEGSKLLYNKDGWKVYKIESYEASAKYGKNTTWCISGENGYEGPEYYQGHEDITYFYIHGDEKFALIWNKGDKYWTIWNDLDEIIPYIPNAPKVEGLPDVSELPRELCADIAKVLGIKPSEIKDIWSASNNPELMELFFDYDSKENYVVDTDTKMYYVIGNGSSYEDVTDEIMEYMEEF